jgi:DNA-binding CsgD family transcriptional regulator
MWKDYINLLNLSDIVASNLPLESAQHVVVKEILEAFRAESAIFFIRDLNSCSLNRHTTAFLNLTSQYVDQYIAHYSQIDPFNKPPSGVYACRDIDVMPWSEIQKLEYYQDFMKPQNVRHSVFLYLHDNGSYVGQICVSRHYKDSPSFSLEDKFKAQLMARLLSLSLKTRRLQEQYKAFDRLLWSNSRNSSFVLDKWNLTPREIQIANFVSQGLTNKEICDMLKISLTTVATHIRHIFEKMQVTSRTKLIYRIINGSRPGEAD